MESTQQLIVKSIHNINIYEYKRQNLRPYIKMHNASPKMKPRYPGYGRCHLTLVTSFGASLS